jgi:hypothetical protein
MHRQRYVKVFGTDLIYFIIVGTGVADIERNDNGLVSCGVSK